MISIALVEDDDNYAGLLEDYLRRYELEKKEKLCVSRCTDGEDIVERYKSDYDIILMDIEMRFMDGMTAAHKIREMDGEVVIIFITNMPQYAIQGYTVDALDYVLKPLSYFAFSQRLDRALSRLKRREDKRYLTIHVRGGVKRIEIGRICYVEVQNHDLIFHTLEGKLLSRGSMREVEDRIGSSTFFRCNKCYLVNLEHVEGVRGNEVVVGKDIVQISRNRKKEFMDSLNNYMNEVSK